jgi:hypothetical protein
MENYIFKDWDFVFQGNLFKVLTLGIYLNMSEQGLSFLLAC